MTLLQISTSEWGIVGAIVVIVGMFLKVIHLFSMSMIKSLDGNTNAISVLNETITETKRSTILAANEAARAADAATELSRSSSDELKRTAEHFDKRADLVEKLVSTIKEKIS